MPKTIINQDRDEKYAFLDRLCIKLVYDKGDLIAVNLFDGNNFLGTFDTADDAFLEIAAIKAGDSPEHFISGYSPWEVD